MSRISRVLLCISVLIFTSVAQAQTSIAQSWQLPTISNAPVVSKNSGAGVWAVPVKPPLVRSASGRKRVDPATRPDAPLFSDASVVVSGFPGITQLKPFLAPGAKTQTNSENGYLTIDLNGASATLVRSDSIGFAPNGAEITTPAYDKILARDVGLVFGIAIDQEPDRSLYLTASSAFGLHIVGRDENQDRIPDRLVTGNADATWMNGQWGSAPSAGPGSVWKVDGATGQVRLLTNIMLNAEQNTGASLGNIAFDAQHRQLFVSDRQTGMIHRLDLTGNDLGHFDHGVSALVRAGEISVPYDPDGNAKIDDRDFDAEDPNTWGYTKDSRLVWGLAVHAGRLFYSVAQGPSIWSVGLDSDTGDFQDDAQRELTIDAPHPSYEISDLVFDAEGGLILAQRGKQKIDASFKTFTRPEKAQVLRFVREVPDDPEMASEWVQTPRVMPVGFAADENNTTGGVAIGPSYDSKGNWDFSSCGGTLWTTGEQLRNQANLASALKANGEMLVDGVQAQPAYLDQDDASPPWQSFHFDYDGAYPDDGRFGHIGDVEALGCLGGGPGDIYYVSGPPRPGCDPAIEVCHVECIGDDCPCDKPDGCFDNPPPPRSACLDSFVKNICQASSGTFEAVTLFDPKASGIDRIELKDLSGALSVPSDVSVDDILKISLGALVPGQQAQIRACGYSAAQKATGGPYDCCEVDLTLSLPVDDCEKGTE